jgi:hypothetical protein
MLNNTAPKWYRYKDTNELYRGLPARFTLGADAKFYDAAGRELVELPTHKEPPPLTEAQQFWAGRWWASDGSSY